jgi:hypothetical protein
MFFELVFYSSNRIVNRLAKDRPIISLNEDCGWLWIVIVLFDFQKLASSVIFNGDDGG